MPEKLHNRGGAREGAGRPPSVPGQPVKRINVSLDAETVEILKEFGDGQLSEGIRRAARYIRDGG